MRRKRLTHFSHDHPLHETNVKEQDGLTCSCCLLGISGPGAMCKHQECDFLVHRSCLELPQRIRHKSHPEHALTLVCLPALLILCNACGDTGTGFFYNCSVCDFDIHVKCSSLPETVKRDEHKHPVSLQYSIVNDNEDVEFVCDVCEGVLKHGCWVYYCKDCDFGIHLDCLPVERKETGERKEDQKEDQNPKGASSTLYGTVALMNRQIKALEQLQLKHMQMQTSYLEAQEQLQVNQMQMQTSYLEAQRQLDKGRSLAKMF